MRELSEDKDSTFRLLQNSPVTSQPNRNSPIKQRMKSDVTFSCKQRERKKCKPGL